MKEKPPMPVLIQKTRKTLIVSSLLICFSSQAAKFNPDTLSLESFKADELGSFNSLDSLIDPTDNTANTKFAIDFLMQKRFDRAHYQINQLIISQPTNSSYYNLRALAYYGEKKFALAKESYATALKLNEKNSQALLGLAMLSLNEKNYDQTRQYAEQALRYNAFIPQAYALLAEVSFQKSGYEAAEKELLESYSKVKGNFSTELKILQSIRNLYLTHKHPEKILPLAQSLDKTYPNQAESLAFLAEAHLVNNQSEQAEQVLRQLIQQNPTDVKQHINLARLISRRPGTEPEVIKLMDQAVKNSNNAPQVLALKTAYLISKQKFPEALKIAQSLDKNSDQPLGQMLMGDLFFAQNELATALEHYQKAYQSNSDIKILDAILKIYARQKQSDNIISLLKAELKKQPENSAIQLRLADYYLSIEQYAPAVKYYEPLLSQYPENAILLNNLAWAYIHLNNPKAIKLGEKAVSLQPNAATIQDTYGYALLKNKKIKQAIDVLEQAQQLNPKLDSIKLNLAEAYILDGNKARAKSILDDLINQNGSSKNQALELKKQL